MSHILREAWLTKLTEAMRDSLFANASYTMPDNVRVSVGWPRSTRKAIGQCWPPSASSDGTSEVFISPVLSDTMAVAATLAHELAHATVGNEHAHDKIFTKAVRAIGLTGKPTATIAGEAFKLWAAPVLAELGEYPHAALNPNDRKKQTTRLIRCHCEQCDSEDTPFIARLSAATIASHGTPICPVHTVAMTAANAS